jgi:16S rRNA (cytosine967-C5)-methyltransferase
VRCAADRRCGGGATRPTSSNCTAAARLLTSAIDSTAPGGVVAYITCSPHRRESADVVAETLGRPLGPRGAGRGGLLPELSAATVGPYLQLWPHRHGTDAMFAAYLRRRARV